MGCTIRYEYGLFTSEDRGRLPGGAARQLAGKRQPVGNACARIEAVEVRFGGYVEEVTEGRPACSFDQKDYSHRPRRALRYARCGLRHQHGEHAAHLVGQHRPSKSTCSRSTAGDYVRAMEETRAVPRSSPRCSIPKTTTTRARSCASSSSTSSPAPRCSTSVRDFEKTYGPDWDIFPDKVAIHVNDTHPGHGHPRADAHSAG